MIETLFQLKYVTKSIKLIFSNGKYNEIRTELAG